MPTITTELPVVRPVGWDVPEAWAGVDTLRDMRERIDANDAEVDRLHDLAVGIERDNAYGVATLALSIVTAIDGGMAPADVAVAIGYKSGDRSGEMFVSRYRVIGEAVSHGCDTDAVLSLRTLVREGVKAARSIVKASLTDDGLSNEKLAKAIVKAGKPAKAPLTDAEQVSKRLVTAHNALSKVAEAVANGTPLTDADKETVTNIVTLLNALTS